MAWFPRRGSAPQPPLRQQGWGPSPPPSGNDQSQPNSHRLPANTPFNRSRLSRAEHPSVLPCTSAQLAPALLVWSPALAPFPGATRYWPSALPTLCQPYCAASRRRVPNQTIAYAHPLRGVRGPRFQSGSPTWFDSSSRYRLLGCAKQRLDATPHSASLAGAFTRLSYAVTLSFQRCR